jgi:alpha-L-fucosidase
MYQGRGNATMKMARELQPDILLNNRTGDGGDYDTPEQRIGGFQMNRPWETCMTICRQWAWKPDDTMKSLEQCLQTLIRTAGGDGNLLFNVGPTAEGVIEARQVERLKEMGAWLAKHGESIYATRGGPYKPAKHIVSTRKSNTVFLHILAWPEETLTLPALPAKVVKASANVQQTDTALIVKVPAADRQPIDTIVALELDKPAMEIEPISVSGTGDSLTTGKKAKASNVFQKNNHYGAAMAVDGDHETRWATDASTASCWLEVDLGKAETFNRAVIQECVDFGERVKAFELQYKDGDAWRTFHSGKAVGKNLEVKFETVTARIVRLNITEGQGGPTINEFQLFTPKK